MHRRMQIGVIRIAATIAGLVGLSACADRATVGPTDGPNFNHTGDLPPFDHLGHWGLCKVGSDATFDVVVNGGTPTTVNLADGECQDVALTPATGGSITVTVTELVDPAQVLDSIGYTAFSRSGSTTEIVTGTNSITRTINGDVQGTATFYNELVPAAPGRITGVLDRAEATQERLMQYMTRGQE